MKLITRGNRSDNIESVRFPIIVLIVKCLDSISSNKKKEQVIFPLFFQLL